MKQKIVYIIGAGFSLDAGAPLQSALVKEIFKLVELQPHLFKHQKVKKFQDFLDNILVIQQSMWHEIPLEDIFTPLDRCIADNISFRSLNITEVKEIREIVYYLIGVTLNELLKYNIQKEYINTFAEFLHKNCIGRKELGYKNPKTDKGISNKYKLGYPT